MEPNLQPYPFVMKTEDIRITQYALGELSGSDREAFEKEMAADPELLEEVRQTQQFCETMPTSPEPEAAFTEAEREAMLQRIRQERLQAAESRPRSFGSRLVIYGGLAAAACILASLSIPAVTGSLRKSASPSVARLDGNSQMLPQPVGTPASGVAANVPPVAELDRSKNETAAKGEVVAALVSDKPAKLLTQRELKESPSEPEQFTLLAQPEASLPADEAKGKSVPVVGDVPLVGRLFKDEEKRADSTAQVPAAPVAVAAPEALAGARAPSTQLASGNGAIAGMPASKAGSEVSRRVDLMTAPQVTTSSGLAAKVDVVREFVYPSEFAPPQEGASYRPQTGEFNTEGYDYVEENRFLGTIENPLSTFSIDVDTASYSNIRRFLAQQNQLPPKGAVRVEELINYFPYTYPQPEGADPFSVNVEVSKAPWNPAHELVRIGLKGRELSAEKRPASNLVFLVDVSGSMDAPDKLPLLQKSLLELTSRLAAKDRVAMVVYAGSSGLVLPSTTDKAAIREALERLRAGGSTNGGAGIKLAYREARENFLEDGNNRVILCTDGDFNVGVTNRQALVDLIEKERKSGVFLSVLGFGTGNLKDSQMEQLADKGNGNYAYIDSIAEGRKVLGEQMGGTLFTIAKDVKIQIEFNPATVSGYRLIGYENRVLAKEDFNNDKKDAGEIGAGHTVTAFYEVIPAGQPLPDVDSVDALKYQSTTAENPQPSEAKPNQSAELLTVKLRYKQPDGDTSEFLEVPVPNAVKEWDAASEDFRFGAAVAAFGQKLRGSKALKDFNWSEIQKLARPNLGDDPGSYRAEFLTLIEKTRQIDENR